MNAGCLIILHVASLLEGRDAQNERDRAAAAAQHQLRHSSMSSVATAAAGERRRHAVVLR